MHSYIMKHYKTRNKLQQSIQTYIYPRVKRCKDFDIIFFGFIRLIEYNSLLYKETLQNPQDVTAIHTYIHIFKY